MKTPFIQFENVKDVVVRDCSAFEGTDVFLQFDGTENKDVTLINNRLKNAQEPIRFKNGASKALISEER